MVREDKEGILLLDYALKNVQELREGLIDLMCELTNMGTIALFDSVHEIHHLSEVIYLLKQEDKS